MFLPLSCRARVFLSLHRTEDPLDGTQEQSLAGEIDELLSSVGEAAQLWISISAKLVSVEYRTPAYSRNLGCLMCELPKTVVIPGYPKWMFYWYPTLPLVTFVTFQRCLGERSVPWGVSAVSRVFGLHSTSWCRLPKVRSILGVPRLSMAKDPQNPKTPRAGSVESTEFHRVPRPPKHPVWYPKYSVHLRSTAFGSVRAFWGERVPARGHLSITVDTV